MDTQTGESRAVDGEIERLVAAARDALTDEMVGRLATTAADAADLMDQVNRAGLARAIPALAQMAHNGDLERLGQLARVYSSAQDSLTDEMVGRLSATIGDGMALMDQVNRAGLDRAIPALAEMVHNGDLQRLVKLARVYGSAEDAVTDEMVGRLSETVGHGLSLLDRFARGGADRVIGILERLESSGALQKLSDTLPDLAERMSRIQAMLAAIESAALRTSRMPPSRGGLGGMWELMRDPEAQDTLRFLLAVGKELRGALTPPAR
ncbi:MAG: hypothetical protein LT103_13230 [Burkholderiaceae bacterium]|nr:hypothetical protein [Burkholderiaceae bacterium]